MKRLFQLAAVLSIFNVGCLLAQSLEPTAASSHVLANQYCQFLNATAVTDFHNFYDEKMAVDFSSACIARTGVPGTYHYDVIEGRENVSVPYISRFNQIRYCHWVDHGHIAGTTGMATAEEGTIILSGDDDEIFSHAVAKQDGVYTTAQLGIDALSFFDTSDPLLKSNIILFDVSNANAQSISKTSTSSLSPGFLDAIEGISALGLFMSGVYLVRSSCRSSEENRAPENLKEEHPYLEKADAIYHQQEAIASADEEPFQTIDQRVNELVTSKNRFDEVHQHVVNQAALEVARRDHLIEQLRATQATHRFMVTDRRKKHAEERWIESQRTFTEANRAWTTHPYYRQYGHPVYHALANWRDPRSGFQECFDLFRISERAKKAQEEAASLYQQACATAQDAKRSKDDAVTLAEESDSARIARLINEDDTRNDAYGRLTTATNELRYLFSEYQRSIFPWAVREFTSAVTEGRAPKIEQAIQFYIPRAQDYPRNQGFLGAFQWRFVMPGETVMRYGNMGGRFLAPFPSEREELAIPAHVRIQNARMFKVLKPFPSVEGMVAPAFDQRGLGKQMVLPSGIDVHSLLNAGCIQEIFYTIQQAPSGGGDPTFGQSEWEEHWIAPGSTVIGTDGRRYTSQGETVWLWALERPNDGDAMKCYKR